MTFLFRFANSLRGGTIAAVLSLIAATAFGAEPRALWTLAPASSLVKSTAGVHRLDIHAQALGKLTHGDVAHFELPGGSTYAATTVRTEQHTNGDQTWVGKFDYAGKTYTSILTYGDAAVIGSMRTPEGLFYVRMDGSQPVLIDLANAGWQAAEWGNDMSFSNVPTGPQTPETAIGEREAAGLKPDAAVNQTIDVLIGYTDGFVTNNGSQAAALTRINNLIALTNQAYIDSQVLITLRLVHAVQVTYPDNTTTDAALDDLRNGAGAVPVLLRTTLRDRYGADITVLLRRYTLNQGGCGLADVGGFNGNGATIGNLPWSNSYAVVFDGQVNVGMGFSFCQEGTFAHEVGHNMGALHDAATNAPDPRPGAFAYSNGYVTPGAVFQNGSNQCPNGSQTCFGTIMAYVNQTPPETLKFSNPNVSTCGGAANQACGTAAANVALSFNNTSAGVASWRATRVPFIGTKSGDPQTAAPLAAFGQPLKVTLRDALNNLVPGVTVTFSAPGAGASANLSATTVVTNAQGEAQVTATANAIPGTYQVTATANPGFVTTVVTFNLTNGVVVVTPTLTVQLKGNGTGTVTGTAPSAINCPAVSCVSPPMPANTEITLTANATNGAVFTGWLGTPGCLINNTQCLVKMDANKTVQATFAPPALLIPAGTYPSKVDPDLNGKYLALEDGLMVIRFLFQLTNPQVTQSAIGQMPGRTDSDQIVNFLNNIKPQLDIDGDGRADPLTDGIVFLRYLFSFREPNLTKDIVFPPNAKRTAAEMQTYIGTMVGP